MVTTVLYWTFGHWVFVVWERQHGQVGVLLTRTRVHQKMRETELSCLPLVLMRTPADNPADPEGSRDGAATIELDCYWKPNAVNKFCNLSVYIHLSVSLFQSTALSMSFCGTVHKSCRNRAYMYVTIMCVCANQILHTTQFKPIVTHTANLNAIKM